MKYERKEKYTTLLTTLCRATTRLLAYWYSHQQLGDRWHNMHPDYFSMSNGVRRGGILSPFLFRFYRAAWNADTV